MGMNIGSSGGDEGDVVPEMNTTPLIDVMLVLLVMIIVTIPAQLHAVKLENPQGNPPPVSEQKQPVRVDIDFDGTLLVDGTPLADHAALEARFRGFAAMKLADQPEVHIRPNKLVPYKNVVAVMASAQRIGVKKIGIIGGEQFM